MVYYEKVIENETKEQRGWFLNMSLGTLGASLLGNLLAKMVLFEQAKEQQEQVQKDDKG